MSAAAEDGLSTSLGWGHERVELVQDPESGLRAIIAIHSTVLGPSLGGMRIRGYAGGVPEALDDALRLSRAMTLKASAAGLDLGGGKAVIIDDGCEETRSQRITALAREIDRLGGAYITAEDVGTTTADMDLVASQTAHVVGRSSDGRDGGDPSPDTARTVLGAIEVALAALDGDDGLRGRRVGVIGTGKVGGRLAEWLLAAGAEVIAFDPVPASLARVAELGAQPAHELETVLGAELDVLAPCAVGGLVDLGVATELRARVICGAANNPLAGEGTAALLAERGVLYVPDFMANCGGLIHADAERRGDSDRVRIEAALEDAKERVAAVLAEALDSQRLPSVVAEEHALERVERQRELAHA